MKIEFDPDKRVRTLAERGLDFYGRSAGHRRRFAKTFPDLRVDYGEDRFITFGWMSEVAVAVVWTERDGVRRIIDATDA